MSRYCFLTTIILVVAAFSLTPTRAQGTRTLATRVATLERVVTGLDARLRKLESAGGNRPKTRALKDVGFAELDGTATIMASDGTFLGLITSKTLDRRSILNEIGPHGGSISSKSIFNTIGKYGSTISSQSPWNEIASSPPKVFLGRTFVGYLTVNTIKTPRIDPHALVGYLKSRK